MTTLPLESESFTGFPSTSLNCQSGAVGFNLGVELGQLCVAAIVLPILWNLRRNPSFVRRWVPGCSLAVAFAGCYWMIERVMQR